MRKALLIICGAALALAFAPLPGMAQPAPDGVYVDPQPQSMRRAACVTPTGQIACGRYGCVRIPPNCHPEQSYDWRGNPTGSDAIVCR